MYMYHCWFPVWGQGPINSDAFMADTPAQAAELAAHRRCRYDTEWEDHIVAVVKDTGLPVSGECACRFEVQVESLPVFTASPC